MRTDLKIDFLAPPFAGHLFPQLQLARYAKSQGLQHLRMFSCPIMQPAVEKSGIEFMPVLVDREAEVIATLMSPENIIHSIRGMFTTLRKVVDYNRQFQNELRNYWQADRPDLIVIDFLSPFAAMVADELDIPWWTAISSPTFIEPQTGPPTFLGGWEPRNTLWDKCRDACGRSFVRSFKKTAHWIFRKQMQSLAFNSLYRKDGSERMYSHEKILGLGIPELQFNTLWPKALHWLGPCPESPVFDHPEPQYEQGRKHILVSLGTQVPWAKERAEKVFRKVASLLPEYMFHFTLGRTALKEPRRENNLHCYGYLPYTPETFRHYDVIVNHGGIGAMYTSIIAGVPQLVWPQDFDQPDCAAQVNYHKVGLRTNGKTQDIVIKIKRLMENEIYRKRSVEFQEIIKRYHPGKTFVELLEKRFS